jgi:cellobiose phosphorylase
MKAIKTKYGRFSPDGKEFIINVPATPRPWINVISNGDYGFTVSQTGSGYSWRTHAQLNRLTRWEQDLIKDEWGKYLYIRDERGNIWSAGWKPVCAKPESYQCRHGIGYSIIDSRYFAIESRLSMFVPNGQPLEIWILTLKNRSRRNRSLDIFTYCEWALGQSPDWHREFHKSFIETEYDAGLHAVLATKRLWEVPTDRGHWNTNWPYVAFHSSDRTPKSFGTDKETFLGMYGTQAMPAAVTKGRLSRRAGNWLDPCASIHHRVALKPGGECSFVYTLGCADSRAEASDLITRYSPIEAASDALVDVHARWDSILGTVRSRTPDDAMDVMQNTWLKYQAISGRMWARTAYYQTGGAYGYRDQLQDSLLWLTIDPEMTKQQILLHARHQFLDGTVYHWWHPLSETGLHNGISDNLLWLPYVTNAYLEETGDASILDLRVPSVDNPEPLTIYEHCTRAIERALVRFSDRGLPLIGEGDWNDGLSAVGLEMKGESVWLGHFLHRILLDFCIVARRRNDEGRAEEYCARGVALKERINALAWDGDYYFGATKDSGEKLGSHENAEGSVWLNPQTWAVIGGVAGPERAEKVFDVVEQRLEKDIGPVLLTPAYATPDRQVGYLTRYSPGMRENGGVYTHAATWAIVAAAVLGRGESAYRIYQKLNPIIRARDADRYFAEPYVTSGNIEGPESAFFGRGGWTWYSGSAAWLFRAGLEYILGVRGTFDGLLVDPCIPRHWDGYTVKRTFRGAVYNIEVRNPEHVEVGVREVHVDGEAYGSMMGPREKRFPVFEPGSTHNIIVVLGGIK